MSWYELPVPEGMPEGLVNIRLDLVQRDKALTGKQYRATTKDQFAAPGFTPNRDPNRAVNVVRMDFVIGSINMPRCLKQSRIKDVGHANGVRPGGQRGRGKWLMIAVHDLRTPISINMAKL